jgi:hypothetical protein
MSRSRCQNQHSTHSGRGREASAEL